MTKKSQYSEVVLSVTCWENIAAILREAVLKRDLPRQQRKLAYVALESINVAIKTPLDVGDIRAI